MSFRASKQSRFSLREKLPLMASLLVAGSLVLAGALAYAEVRELAQAETADLLDARSSELATLFEAELARRTALQERVAKSRAVRGALLTSWVDTADVKIALDSLRNREDGFLPVAVLRPDGATIFSTGSMPEGVDPDPDPPLGSVHSYGPVRAVGASNLFWETVPIVGSANSVLGWLAQRRRFAPNSRLALLWGDGTRVRIGQTSDSAWHDLRGNRSYIPRDSVHVGPTFVLADSSEGPSLARARRIAGTPWVVLFDVPFERVYAGARIFLTRIATLGGFLVIGSIALILIVSRRLTRPLVELAQAADAMHDGDYRRRVAVERDDEIGTLASAFNRMAAQVEQSHVALRGRLGEARSLAERLAQSRKTAEDAKREAEEANEAKADALAAISHDIRAPLAAVMAYAEMLQDLDSARHPEKVKTYAERIEECSEMLTSLATDLLDFSCIGSGRLRVDIAPTRVDAVVRFAMRSLEPKARDKGIALRYEGSGAMAFLGDGRRVRQIIVNLLSNAVSYTSEGGGVTVRSRIEREVSPPGKASGVAPWILIEVEDTGPGIDPEDLEGIFEPFRRAGTGSRDGSGAGLGLAISKQLALMMDGTVTVRSQRGVGSCFTLWLPNSARRPAEGRSPDPEVSRALRSG
jgi:signal transduction histidine kinase